MFLGMMDKIMLSTHLQAFFVDADHHPCVLTLHTEAYSQNALLLLRLSIFPWPSVMGGGQMQVGQSVRHWWSKGKGYTGPS